MEHRWWPWVMRGLWLTLPFTAGQVLGDAFGDASRAVELTGTVGLWLAWGTGVFLTLIPHALTLTPLRIIAPAGVAATLWATFAEGMSGVAVAGLSLAVLAAVVSLSPQLGAWFVNGSSYGDERRLPLRPPGPLLAGPIPLAWLVVVVGAAAGPLFLAARQWVLGGVMTVLGLAGAAVAARALHALTRRWLVFVPAGVVLHDHMSVSNPVLFKRSAVQSIGPALADTSARDLSQGSLGLALELQVRTPVELTYRESGGSEPRSEELDAIVVSVSRPGMVLAEARRHGIAVG